MTGAVDDIGEALALTGRVTELCTILEGADCDTPSVDLRDAQRRVSWRTISIAGRSRDVGHETRRHPCTWFDFKATFALSANPAAADAPPIKKAPTDAIRVALKASMACSSR